MKNTRKERQNPAGKPGQDSERRRDKQPSRHDQDKHKTPGKDSRENPRDPGRK